MMNPEDTLSDYHKIDAEVRARARQVKLEYRARVPQASWLRLDLDGAVLLTPAEFSQLPQLSREFFLDGNTSHYRNDRVAMRGERTILLDGYYSGGPTGEMRVDYFLETAQRYQKAVPEVLRELSDDEEGQWKAKLAVWDNLINLSAAQFHGLKAITLLYNYPPEEKNQITNNSRQLMSDMFEGYFLTLCGQPTDHLVARCSDDILGMIDIESSLSDCFPNARLAVVTLGQQGSMIRFEDRLIKIPAVLVDSPIDVLGAGDTYMGTMLGQLFNQPYELWNFNLVKNAARVATFAASEVVQSMQARLTFNMAQQALEFKNLL